MSTFLSGTYFYPILHVFRAQKKREKKDITYLYQVYSIYLTYQEAYKDQEHFTEKFLTWAFVAAGAIIVNKKMYNQSVAGVRKITILYLSVHNAEGDKPLKKTCISALPNGFSVPPFTTK